MFTLIQLMAGALATITGGDLLRDDYLPRPAAPRVQAAHSPQDSSRRRTAQHTYSHVVQNGSNATEINYRGKIAFTDDERDIKSISPGGYFKFSKTTFGNTRSVLIESSGDGVLMRTYHADRQEQPYEPEGRKWLADMLPEIIATSGIGAEERVRRIYAKKGVNGVLETIEAIENDHARSIYLGYLMEQPNLAEKDRLTVLDKVSGIGSDHEKANLLRRMSGTCLRGNQTSQAYIRAASSIGSDHEKSQLFRHLLGSLSLNEANTAAVTKAVASIGSDHEKAGVVRFLLGQNKLDGSGLQQVLPVIGSIGSDHEKAGVLRAMLGNQAITGTHFKTLAGLIDRLGSDHEKSGVIGHLVNTNQPLVATHFGDVLGLVTRMSSDHEKGRSLAVLLDKMRPDDKQYVQVLAALPSIGSDHEKGQLLTRLAKTLPKGNAAVREAYRKAAKSIGSDHEYRRVMEAIE